MNLHKGHVWYNSYFAGHHRNQQTHPLPRTVGWQWPANGAAAESNICYVSPLLTVHPLCVYPYPCLLCPLGGLQVMLTILLQSPITYCINLAAIFFMRNTRNLLVNPDSVLTRKLLFSRRERGLAWLHFFCTFLFTPKSKKKKLYK